MISGNKTKLEGAESTGQVTRRLCPSCEGTGYLVGGHAVAKCEECGTEAPSNPWPTRWTQCGRSKYGVFYQANGIAWHCPKHRLNP